MLEHLSENCDAVFVYRVESKPRQRSERRWKTMRRLAACASSGSPDDVEENRRGCRKQPSTGGATSTTSF
jgi:hypothetical protein